MHGFIHFLLLPWTWAWLKWGQELFWNCWRLCKNSHFYDWVVLGKNSWPPACNFNSSSKTIFSGTDAPKSRNVLICFEHWRSGPLLAILKDCPSAENPDFDDCPTQINSTSAYWQHLSSRSKIFSRKSRHIWDRQISGIRQSKKQLLANHDFLVRSLLFI